MTRADDFHVLMREIESRNDPGEILQLAKAFYERVSFEDWSFGRFHECYGGTWSSTISWRGLEPMAISYDSRNNRWHLGGQISDARIAEILGVPIAFLNGFCEALDRADEFMCEASRKSEKADDNRRKSLDERRRARDRYRASTFRAACSREAKKAKRDAGQRAAREIARARREIERIRLAKTQAELLERLGRVPDSISYPEVPGPTCEVSDKDASELPVDPGIYFVWRASVVVYVGQSVCLRERAHLKHEKIRDGDYVSWVMVPQWQLDFAECFYIGVCRPAENFGKKAWVRKAKKRTA